MQDVARTIKLNACCHAPNRRRVSGAAFRPLCHAPLCMTCLLCFPAGALPAQPAWRGGMAGSGGAGVQAAGLCGGALLATLWRWWLECCSLGLQGCTRQGYIERRLFVSCGSILGCKRGIQNACGTAQCCCFSTLLLQTIAGRRRYLPEINSKSGQKRAAAERKAKNTVAQVCAGGVLGMLCMLCLLRVGWVCWAC